MTPFVSVIIPVFDDSERLRLCLGALEKQTYPGDKYEILVVDNGSSEDTASVVAEFGQAKLAHEQRPGSYSARNEGLRLAQGEVIAFTDSDCIPSPEWIEGGVQGLLSAPGCGLVAGRVEVFPQDPERPTAVELYEMVDAFRQKRNVEIARFGVTANLFTFSSVFEKVGKFNEDLFSGGDRDWGERVFSAGYGQSYAERAVVHHPARRSFSQLHAKLVRVAGGAHVLRGRKSSFMGLNRQFFADFIPPLRPAWRVLLHSKFRRGDRVKAASMIMLTRYVRIWERIRQGLAQRRRR